MSSGSDAGTIGSHEVTGPSAVGGGSRRFWDLVLLSSMANFRRRYANTALGFAWTFLSPLALYGVLYLFVIEIIRRFVDQIPHYGVILLLNIMLFHFFQQASSQAMRSLVGGGGVVRKMSLPRLVLPMSAVLAALYVLAANLLIAFVWIIASGVEPMWSWLLLPALLVPLIVLTCGVSLLLAGLFVRVRDVGQIWPVLSRIIFYASPILFPLEVIPRQILWEAEAFNPLAPIFVQSRVWIIDSNAPGWFEARGSGFEAWGPFLVFALLCILGVVVFSREARRAAEDL